MQPAEARVEVAVDGPPLVVMLGGGTGSLLILIALVALVAGPRGSRSETVPQALPASGEPGSAALPADAPGREAPPEPRGVVARLAAALERSRAALHGRFESIFGGPVDEAALEQLEETLLLADVGVATAGRITERVRTVSRSQSDPGVLRAAMREEMGAILAAVHRPMAPVPDEGPLVILVVGVNGSGKTTTIGKLAARYGSEGHGVLVAAGDTYRAAAADQLRVWADRAGADFVSQAEGADPGAVVWDALEAARARGKRVVIVDTAGRLQTRKPLMEQLSKLRRVIQKQVPEGPHETLLVLDGTMGQNGLSQATLFNEATPLSGVVVTKLDGTAKGGMVLTIASELGLPVKFIGIGEAVDDLRPFDPHSFVEALA